MFAAMAYQRDQRIRERIVVREVTDAAPLGPNDNPAHVTWVDGRQLLVGYPDCYLNHSCDPNAFLRYEADGIFLVARRPVAAGEEITLDYLINNSGGESWPCDCGERRCRGKTGVSFFTLPPEIQREYLPLLAPWFVRRHRIELRLLSPPAEED
jgi:hypothetical protein